MEFSNTTGALEFIRGVFLLHSVKGAKRFIMGHQLLYFSFIVTFPDALQYVTEPS